MCAFFARILRGIYLRLHLLILRSSIPIMFVCVFSLCAVVDNATTMTRALDLENWVATRGGNEIYEMNDA